MCRPAPPGGIGRPAWAPVPWPGAPAWRVLYSECPGSHAGCTREGHASRYGNRVCIKPLVLQRNPSRPARACLVCAHACAHVQGRSLVFKQTFSILKVLSRWKTFQVQKRKQEKTRSTRSSHLAFSLLQSFALIFKINLWPFSIYK